MRAVLFSALVAAFSAPAAEGAWQCKQANGAVLSSSSPAYCARYYPNCMGTPNAPAACLSPGFQSAPVANQQPAAPANGPAIASPGGLDYSQLLNPANLSAAAPGDVPQSGGRRRPGSRQPASVPTVPAWKPVPPMDVPFTEASCQQVQRRGKPTTYPIGRFTNYEPEKRGINGSCGKSATAGLDACKYFLENHVEGTKPVVMVAVPQVIAKQAGRGDNRQRIANEGERLFGGVYRLDPLWQKGIQPVKGQCVLGMAADHYATDSNYRLKMDVVTRRNTKYATAVNSARGTIVLTGTVTELRSGGSRPIMRKPAALGAN